MIKLSTFQFIILASFNGTIFASDFVEAVNAALDGELLKDALLAMNKMAEFATNCADILQACFV